MIDFYFFKKGSVGVQFPANRAKKEQSVTVSKGYARIIGI